jgi:hypothetical protein
MESMREKIKTGLNEQLGKLNGNADTAPVLGGSKGEERQTPQQ